MVSPPKTPKLQKAPVVPSPTDAKLTSISPRQEKLIGKTVVIWSFLENQMSELIWALLGINVQKGRTVTTSMGAVSKIKMIRELAKPLLPEERFNFLTVTLDYIDIFREDRNNIVHGTRVNDQNLIPVILSIRQKPLAADEIVSEAYPEIRMKALIQNIGISGTRLRIVRAAYLSSLITHASPP
jgi:hypothetical protein